MNKQKDEVILDERKLYKREVRRMLPDLIIIPLIVGLLVFMFISDYHAKQQYTQQLDSLSCLSLGNSKRNIEESLGIPAHIAAKNDYNLCTFLSDTYVVQTAFDSSDILKAYLVTDLNNHRFQIDINGNFYLSKNSFYDYPGCPDKVFGYVSQGIARCLYAEQYISDTGNNWLAVADFGKLSVPLSKLVKEIQLGVEYVDDEVDMSIVTSPQTLANRTQISPNTYGASDSLIGIDEMYNLFFLYDNFDSLTLREENMKR